MILQNFYGEGSAHVVPHGNGTAQLHAVVSREDIPSTGRTQTGGSFHHGHHCMFCLAPMLATQCRQRVCAAAFSVQGSVQSHRQS